jgi:hypothetical protein
MISKENAYTENYNRKKSKETNEKTKAKNRKEETMNERMKIGGRKNR